MAMEADGSAVLMVLAQKASEISFSKSDLSKIAILAISGKIKEKGISISQLRKIADAIGRSDFQLTLDTFVLRDITALAKRIDPRNKSLKTADEASIRNRVSAILLDGEDPAVAEPRPTPATRASGSKTGKALQSKALKPRVSKRAPQKKAG